MHRDALTCEAAEEGWAEEAVVVAEAEGWKLHLSATSNTGYLGVSGNSPFAITSCALLNMTLIVFHPCRESSMSFTILNHNFSSKIFPLKTNLIHVEHESCIGLFLKIFHNTEHLID